MSLDKDKSMCIIRIMKFNSKMLTEQRILSGLTMTELARKVEVYPSTIYRWEKGEREPNGEMLIRIASALNCDPKGFYL